MADLSLANLNFFELITISSPSTTMIQRIQTLFLLFVVVLSLLLLWLPVYEFPDISPATAESATPAVEKVKAYLITNNTLLTIINGAIGVMSLLAIFLFRQRNLQLRICNVVLLLLCIMVGFLFFLADTMGTNLEQRISYQYGAYFPLLQLVFTFLAARGIRKDEELIRSADRLR
ncbi:MAG: hypothetical protein RIQ47_1862 [Bacteroidota bacterium]|jgi:hypothetical protein